MGIVIYKHLSLLFVTLLVIYAYKIDKLIKRFLKKNKKSVLKHIYFVSLLQNSVYYVH